MRKLIVNTILALGLLGVFIFSGSLVSANGNNAPGNYQQGASAVALTECFNNLNGLNGSTVNNSQVNANINQSNNCLSLAGASTQGSGTPSGTSQGASSSAATGCFNNVDLLNGSTVNNSQVNATINQNNECASGADASTQASGTPSGAGQAANAAALTNCANNISFGNGSTINNSNVNLTANQNNTCTSLAGASGQAS